MGNNTVLFVDDEINVLNSLKRGLFDEEYRACFAISGSEALEIMRKHDISVVVSDMRMPVMNGLQFLKTVKEQYPKVMKIVLSGYAQLPQILSTINQVDIFKFILKPWSLEDEFKPVIRQAIDHYNLQREKELQQQSLQKRTEVYLDMLKSSQEKFEAYNRHFENIGRISLYAFNIMKGILKYEDKYLSNSYFQPDIKAELVEELYEGYINTLSVTTDYFRAEKLIKDISQYFNSSGINSKMKLNITKVTDTKIRGNEKFTYSFLIWLLKCAANIKMVSSISLSVKPEEGEVSLLVAAHKDVGVDVKNNLEQINQALGEFEVLQIALCDAVGYSLSKEILSDYLLVKLCVSRKTGY